MTIDEIKKFIDKELDRRTDLVLRSPILDAYNKGVIHGLEQIGLMIRQVEGEKENATL